jgi:NADH:ubiquinone oxidoreductase subunit 6 (subunit J)
LHAEFVAAAQVVVYAGAVMVLYLFVVAYIGGFDEPLRPETGGVALLGPLFAVAVGIELCVAFVASGLEALDTRGSAPGSARRGGSGSCCSRTSCCPSRPPRSSC